MKEYGNGVRGGMMFKKKQNCARIVRCNERNHVIKV